MLFCYKCGCELGNADRCPNCGSDVTAYKEIIHTSNYLYNEGLEKANVRDLSGAVLCLKQSLWYNKDNLEARNLLGLVYYEMGEIVAALCEWIISQNINQERLHVPENLAEYYLNEMQSNKQGMENFRAAIERYNHALECCYNDNLDVAILQLKKVLGLNAHYLRARQLLCLLYIEKKDWKKAEKELHKCLRIDINNTTTLRYLKEVDEQLYPVSAEAGGKKKRSGQTRRLGASVGKNSRNKDGGVVKYKTDNETIIQPIGSKVPGIDGFGAPQGVITAVIGFIIGAAIIAFLVMPQRIASLKSENAEQIRTISAENNAKDATIADLQSQLEAAQVESDPDDTESEGVLLTADSESIDALMQTATAYISSNEDTSSATTVFAMLNPETVKEGESDSFAELFDTLYARLQSPMLERYAWAGIELYESENPDYNEVIENLEIANRYEDAAAHSMTYTQRLYYLGDSYYQLYIAADESERANLSEYLVTARAYLEQANTSTTSDYAAPAATRLSDVVALQTSEE